MGIGMNNITATPDNTNRITDKNDTTPTVLSDVSSAYSYRRKNQELSGNFLQMIKLLWNPIENGVSTGF